MISSLSHCSQRLQTGTRAVGLALEIIRSRTTTSVTFISAGFAHLFHNFKQEFVSATTKCPSEEDDDDEDVQSFSRGE